MHGTISCDGICATDLSRELRDIEACLGAQPSKLYGMGFRSPVAKSTLADANELRDWRMWHDLAAILIPYGQKIKSIRKSGNYLIPA
jgi:hypothetical protein